jgi:hypothetical protein
VRIQTVALLSQNETLLGHPEKDLLCLEEWLAVKKAEKVKDEIKKQENNDTNVLGPLGNEAEQSLGVSKISTVGTVEVGELILEGDDGSAIRGWETPLEILDSLGEAASLDKRRVKMEKWKALEKPAVWMYVACMPPLLFVARSRHEC